MDTDNALRLYEYQKVTLTYIELDEFKKLIDQEIKIITEAAQAEYIDSVNKRFDSMVKSNQEKRKIFQKKITLEMAEQELNSEFPIKRFLEMQVNSKRDSLLKLYKEAIEENELDYQEAKKLLGDDIEKLLNTENQ